MRITARHMEIPERVKEYIDKKLKKLTRFKSIIIDSEIILFNEGGLSNVEGIFFLKNEKKVIKTKGKDFFEAIDRLKDKATRALERFEGKLKAKSRKRG